MPSVGESEGAGRRWRGGRKGGTTLGTPFASDPSLITVLTVSLRLNNNRGSSPVASLLCAYYVYWKDHYTDWTTCALSATRFTISRQRPFFVIQTLQRLHKNESRPSQY